MRPPNTELESGGLGKSGKGDMVIRFENHKFMASGEGILKSWGRENPETFANHFRYSRGAVGHEVNHQGEAEGGAWEAFHGSQTAEWGPGDRHSGVRRC